MPNGPIGGQLKNCPPDFHKSDGVGEMLLFHYFPSRMRRASAPIEVLLIRQRALKGIFLTGVMTRRTAVARHGNSTLPFAVGINPFMRRSL